MMKCSFVALFWLLSATFALGNGDIDRTVILEEQTGGSQRSLRATVGGNLFGSLFKKKMCRKTSEGIFETVSMPRRSSGNPGDTSGACSEKCASLCPDTCFGSSKVEGSKCVCGAFKCSGNAACVGNKCECKIGFSGNGVTCCDTNSGFTLSGSVCVANSQPSGVVAPTTPMVPTVPTSPAVPTVGPPPVTVPIQLPVVPVVAPAPRARQPGKDVVRPKLLDVVALSPLKIDVSNGAGKVDFQITVQDDGSGVKSILVFADSRFRDIFYNQTFETPAVGKIVHNFSMPFSTYVNAGSSLLSFSVSDFADNVLLLTDSEVLADLGYPYDVEVVNTKSELLPPQLLEVKALTPLVVNTTLLSNTATASITFELKVEDDFSGMNLIAVSWQLLPSGSSLSSNFFFTGDRFRYDSVDVPLAGPLLWNMTLTVNRNTPLGVYSAATIQLRDSSQPAFKATMYNATALANLMVPNVTIVK